MTASGLRSWRVTAALVVIAAAGFGCASSGDIDPASTRDVVPDTAGVQAASVVDVGFSRDMSVHHAQAVDMAERVRFRTDDETLATLATDIVLTQQAQIGRMQGWLELWGEPLTSTEPPMGWAGGDATHDSHREASMPGMASNAEVTSLSSEPVRDAERRFLELMIRHHRGGVEMAQAALGADPSVVVERLASSIVQAQTAEISAMEEMLAQRSAADRSAAQGER